MIAYHFTGPTLRDGRPIPPIGEWLEHDGPIVMCKSGLHASPAPFQALGYAPGSILHQVEIDGDLITEEDKCVGRRRRIIASVDTTPILGEFARYCAMQVIHLWNLPDVVRRYLTTGEESLRDAARDAARNAARAVARRAAWSASQAATRRAARTAQAAKFNSMCLGALCATSTSAK